MMTKMQFSEEFKSLVEFYGPKIAKMTDVKADYYYAAFESWRLPVFKTACKLWKNAKADKFPSIDDLRSFKTDAEHANPEGLVGRYPQPQCEFCEGQKWLWFDRDFNPEKYPTGFSTPCVCTGRQLTEEQKAYLRFRKTEASLAPKIDLEAQFQEYIEREPDRKMRAIYERILDLYRSSKNKTAEEEERAVEVLF